jgi:hypothetical protein
MDVESSSETPVIVYKYTRRVVKEVFIGLF